MGWFNRCPHKWEVLSETYEPSVLDKLLASPTLRRMKGLDSDDLHGTYLIICQCTKCGKLDKTIVKV